MLGQVLDPPRIHLVPLVPHIEAFQPSVRLLDVPLGLFGGYDVFDDDETVLLELVDEGRIGVERGGWGVGFDDP